MSNLILKHFAGILVLIIIFFAATNFKRIWGAPKHRGFHCADATLRQPYVKDTVSKSALYTISVTVPVVVMILSEFRQFQWNGQERYFQKFLKISFRLYENIMPFLYGFAAERLLKNVAKFMVTRLRPFFFEACQPLTIGIKSCGMGGFVEDYSCSSKLASASLFTSFPSGHSSLVFYGMVFIALYLQRYSKGSLRNINTFGLLLPLMQLLCIAVALSVAVTRILDFKHFTSDVIVGSALGTTVAVIVSLYRNKYMETKVEEIEKAKQMMCVDNATKTPCPTEMVEQHILLDVVTTKDSGHF